MQEIDLRIGASFTRFQTMLLKDAFAFNFPTDGRNLVLSYGPCQVQGYFKEFHLLQNENNNKIYDYI